MRNFSIRFAVISVALVLTACGGGGGGGGNSASPSPVPTATLNAAVSSVNSGDTTMLTWSSTNATACQASGGWSGALGASGTQATPAITASTTFSLVCTGAGGSSSSVSVTIDVSAAGVPTASLSAAPINVADGSASTLTWSSTGATSCTASGAWSGSLAASGTQSTGALTANATFSLTCSGAAGTSSMVSTQVLVSPPGAPTVVFSASPLVVASGSSSTLTWSSNGATGCTASGGWTSNAGATASSGSQSTGPLTVSTSYSLICTGTGGDSPIQTVTVSIAGALTPKMATIAMNQTTQFAATLSGGAAATWSVDGVANGNSAVGMISTGGLYTPGTTPGLHSILATSTTDATQAQSAVAAVTDLKGVFTYHNDAARDGANSQEYALTPSNVNTTAFGKLTSCPVDGAIYTQPLWVPQLSIGGALHNVVLVATQHDGLFVFDADAVPCVKLWSVNLIDQAHGAAAGETPVPNALAGNGVGDIAPEVGVTGTPVIDAGAKIVYVVTKSIDSTQKSFTRLHAIDLLTGNEKTGAPIVIAAENYPGTFSGGTTVRFDSKQELQRTGLGLASDGNVYVAFGSHGDFGPWFGWLMTYRYSGTGFAQTGVFNTAPDLSSSGIWMSGGAPSFDSANTAYMVTGNGTFDVADTSATHHDDYGDSLLAMTLTPPNLTVSQYFRPGTGTDPFVDYNDNDFGAGGATMLADLPAGNAITHALVCGGKSTFLMVLDRDHLGGFGSSPVQSIPLANKIFATAAFWNNNMYIAGVGGPLQAYTLNTSNAQFSAATSSTHPFAFPGATPSVSAAGTQAGIVWSLDTNGYCTTGGGTHTCGPAVLYAHDTGNLAHELWNSSSVAADAAGNAVKFAVPTIANGHVYIGTRGNDTGGAATNIPGELDIYGLKP